jgi:hypothetical protein
LIIDKEVYALANLKKMKIFLEIKDEICEKLDQLVKWDKLEKDECLRIIKNNITKQYLFQHYIIELDKLKTIFPLLEQDYKEGFYSRQYNYYSYDILNSYVRMSDSLETVVRDKIYIDTCTFCQGLKLPVDYFRYTCVRCGINHLDSFEFAKTIGYKLICVHCKANYQVGVGNVVTLI